LSESPDKEDHQDERTQDEPQPEEAAHGMLQLASDNDRPTRIKQPEDHVDEEHPDQDRNPKRDSQQISREMTGRINRVVEEKD
jgi:hypothetical protein